MLQLLLRRTWKKFNYWCHGAKREIALQSNSGRSADDEQWRNLTETITTKAESEKSAEPRKPKGRPIPDPKGKFSYNLNYVKPNPNVYLIMFECKVYPALYVTNPSPLPTNNFTNRYHHKLVILESNWAGQINYDVSNQTGYEVWRRLCICWRNQKDNLYAFTILRVKCLRKWENFL